MRVRNGRGEVETHGPTENWMTRDPAAEAAAEARAKRSRSGNLRWKYGIDEDEFDLMERAQAGVCAICGLPERVKRRGKLARLSVDHDHATGRVRGLLCTTCNAAMGLLRDDADTILAFAERAVKYLSRRPVIVSGMSAYTSRDD